MIPPFLSETPMSLWTKLLGLLAIWLLATWLGGFTFYSAAVIPVLHDQLGSSLEAGLVTQQVTNTLNLLGAATVGVGGVMVLFEHSDGRNARFRSKAGTGLLAATALCLAVLVVLHRMLDRRLELAEMTHFYPLHRAYLWVSTIQWLTNSALLAGWAGFGWDFLRNGTEKPQVLEPSKHPESPL
jgi:hypothetical protein